MKYIAEKERKFEDQLALKIYYADEPADPANGQGTGGALISVRNKTVLPVEEKIAQEFSLQDRVMAFVMLSGSLNFTDSTGFKKRLTKDDALIIENQANPYRNIVQNSSTSLDAEFIELSISIKGRPKSHMFLGNKGIFSKNALNDYFSGQRPVSIKKRHIQLYRGNFVRGSRFSYPTAYRYNRISVFVIKGEAMIGTVRMNSRDTLFAIGIQSIEMEFTEETSFLLFEVDIRI